MNKLNLLLTLTLLIYGCTESRDDEKANVNDMKQKPAIAWYQGSVQEAFSSALAKDKPVFLYWGAVWCPPCQEIKQTVFKS